MNRFTEFVKSAAEYSQQTANVVETAWGALQEIQAQRTKCAEMAPKTVAALAALTKANGQPFVPEGFEKQASACLTSHQDTIKLLNHVIIEYGKLKEANDRLTPAIGRANGKTASERRPISFDSPESNAMRRFTELCNAE